MAKKTNEAWFGDSFDRGTLTAYNASNGEICFTANNCQLNTSALDRLTGYTDLCTIATADCGSDYAVAKGISGITNEFAVKSDVSTIQSQLHELQEKVDKLVEKSNIATSKLRQGLKTLRYTREVE